MPDKSSYGGDRGRRGRAPNRDHRWILVIGIVACGVEAAALWLRTSRIAGSVVVRCRDGHLFTTIWLPGGSVKSLRLAWWRFQRCPVGGHWSLVTPVRESVSRPVEKWTAHAG
jgi:hypothetical protein